MARMSVVLPESVAEWIRESAEREGVSQSCFISNTLSLVKGQSEVVLTGVTEEQKRELTDEEIDWDKNPWPISLFG